MSAHWDSDQCIAHSKPLSVEQRFRAGSEGMQSGYCDRTGETKPSNKKMKAKSLEYCSITTKGSGDR
jgi:hypothetical protein